MTPVRLRSLQGEFDTWDHYKKAVDAMLRADEESVKCVFGFANVCGSPPQATALTLWFCELQPRRLHGRNTG